MIMCNFEIYTGKQNSKSEMGLGKRVVVNITRPLGGKGHHGYFDNSYTSPALAVALKEIRYIHVAQLELTEKTYLKVCFGT